MAHPRSACGASPSRGRRLRTGGAGSAAPAWWGLRWGLLVGLMVLAAGIVWTTELLNTAIESAVNLATTEYHPMARVAKDVASGATLIASLTAIIVGLSILIPAAIEKFL